MEEHYKAIPYGKILVPITAGCDARMALSAARLIAGQGQVLLKGLVGVATGESLSTAAVAARKVRETLYELGDDKQILFRKQVRVSYNPWDEFMDVVHEERPDLILLEWPCHFKELLITPIEALIRPPCDIALVRGPIPECPERVMVSLRGSPNAENALRLSLAIAHTAKAKVTSLHLIKKGASQNHERSFRGLAQVLASLPEVERQEMEVDNLMEAILEKSRQYDLVVMGTTARPENLSMPIGPVTDRILKDSPTGIIAVKTTRPILPNWEDEEIGQNAISILVDKWFAENTYHVDEFSDLEHLLDLKHRQNLSISLALPALNEEETVGSVIKTVKTALMDEVPLLDEMVLMDSDSIDRTREIAESLGVPVYIHQQVLPHLGVQGGKGDALWKSLYVTHGDILVWIDTDIVNIHPRFVYGLLGPLLANPAIQFIKGFYRRPLKVGDKVQAGGGGRVTELTARPLLNLFYPELSGVVQPLSGEYGGRRSALEQLPFFSGYGVETGLLIDTFEKFGLSAIAQVDLLERVHHNQPLESLGKMSFAIIQAVIRKLESHYGQGFLEDVNKSMKLIRYEPGRLFLEVEEIAERERPPINSLPEYREREA